MAKRKSPIEMAHEIDRALKCGELLPGEKSNKNLRDIIKAIIEHIKTTPQFDIISTDDVVVPGGGKIIIRHPSDKNRKNAIKKANEYEYYLSNNLLCKKSIGIEHEADSFVLEFSSITNDSYQTQLGINSACVAIYRNIEWFKLLLNGIEDKNSDNANLVQSLLEHEEEMLRHVENMN